MEEFTVQPLVWDSVERETWAFEQGVGVRACEGISSEITLEIVAAREAGG